MARIQPIQTADAATLSGFATIIDVRSPGEFALDHIPGAINLPVLTDAERAEVGTIYVQESRLKANRIGAAHVARNIAGYLDGELADMPQTFAPLVYCWRGGSRSESMATILSRVGWRTSLLVGGYKTWRRHVQVRLYDETWPLNLVLLDGDTGTGKTQILTALACRGVQTLDLEGMAGHRGSLFGGLAGKPQPNQKGFESGLLRAMEALDPSLPIVVEAESSRIGDLMVPPALWALMQAAPRIEVSAPRTERARYLVTAYDDITADHALIETMIARLPVHPSQKRLEGWRKWLADGNYAALAEALMALHYDPAYQRGRRKDGHEPMAEIALETLDEQSLDRAVDEIVQLVLGLEAR